MATWIVVASLNHMLTELNSVAPDRDKSSDGSIGDTSHSARPSGHNPDETGSPEDTDADSINEVRARDFDKDLKQAGLTMEMIAQFLVEECRAGRITWIKYIIFNRRIWAAKSGWVTKVYNGANPHDKHMHVSSKPDTRSENDTKPLGLSTLLEDDDMTPAEATTWLKSKEVRDILAQAVLTYDPGRGTDGKLPGGAIPDPFAPTFNAADPKTYGPGVGTISLSQAVTSLRTRADQEFAERPLTAAELGEAVRLAVQEVGGGGGTTDPAAVADAFIARIGSRLATPPEA